MKRYRTWDPDEPYLFPPSPREWLPSNHLVFFVLDVVAHVDLGAIEEAVQSRDPRGVRPYDPRMMVALLVYGYCVGIVSSRRLERAAHDQVPLRVLTGAQQPDHSRISAFRRRHLQALEGLFIQVLRMCQEAGLVKLGRVAPDGTKMEANASKHKAMSYERMKKSEAELAAEVQALLGEAERTDQAEDETYGRDRRGDELPAELARRESRLAKIREAKQKLEAEAAASRARELAERARDARARSNGPPEDPDGRRAERTEQAATEAAHRAAQKARDAGEPGVDLRPREATELPSHQVPATAEGDPKAKAQRNFTDPDSRIMKQGTGFVQGFNAQAAVDEHAQIIVAQAVTHQPPDAEHLTPLLERIAQACGDLPQTALADAGYWSEQNVVECERRGVEALIPPDRIRHGASLTGAADAPTTDRPKDRMRQRLRTLEGRAAYARRKTTVEPVFGQIKQARGLRRFLLRGLESVRAEWSLICATHNLLKLFRYLLAGRGTERTAPWLPAKAAA